jgi:hypothetical protein
VPYCSFRRELGGYFFPRNLWKTGGVAEFPILRGSHTLQSEQSQPNLAYLADAPSRFGSQTVPTVYKRWTKGPRTLLWFLRRATVTSKTLTLATSFRQVKRRISAKVIDATADSCRGQRQAQAVSVRPRKDFSAICSRCHQTAPDYDQLAERRLECDYRASHIALRSTSVAAH